MRRRKKNNHYGIKCKVIGYEWSDNAQQVNQTFVHVHVQYYYCSTAVYGFIQLLYLHVHVHVAFILRHTVWAL